MNLIVFVAIIPVYYICKYIYDKDHQKESDTILTKLFIGGIISAIMTIIVSRLLGQISPIFSSQTKSFNSTELLIHIMIGVALVEETCKWIMVYLVAFKSEEFDESYDGIVYSVFVSLGFAALENIMYVLFSSQNFLKTASLRALTAIPMHACFAIIMGIYLSKAKTEKKNNNNKGYILNIILSILVPTLIHGLYDYTVSSMTSVTFIVLILAIIMLYTYSIKTVNKLSTNNDNI